MNWIQQHPYITGSLGVLLTLIGTVVVPFGDKIMAGVKGLRRAPAAAEGTDEDQMSADLFRIEKHARDELKDQQLVDLLGQARSRLMMVRTTNAAG
jgi:hypothetical protein